MSANLSPAKLRRRRLDQLRRRASFLGTRIANYHGRDDSFDRVERGAILYALVVIETADRLGVLEDIEREANLTGGGV